MEHNIMFYTPDDYEEEDFEIDEEEEIVYICKKCGKMHNECTDICSDCYGDVEIYY